jgi:plasmid stabilization system protein ParE
MAKTLRFHPDVSDDIAEAMNWYEGRSTGLGERFRLAVDGRFDLIADSPEIFGFAFQDLDFRFTRVPKFPYVVLYRIRGEEVFVLGVFHSASNPEKWRRRAHLA